MCEVSGYDETVVAYEGFACGSDAFLAVGCERYVGCAGVSAVQRPFCLAVADYEDTGGRHARGCFVFLGLAFGGVNLAERAASREQFTYHGGEEAIDVTVHGHWVDLVPLSERSELLPLPWPGTTMHTRGERR